MKKIAVIMLLLILLSIPSYGAASSVPLQWKGYTTALGKVNAGYRFMINNVTVVDNGTAYKLAFKVTVFKCINLNVSCPLTKSEEFLIKKSTNTFLLGNGLAFFPLYWPGYSLSKQFHNLGKELKPSRARIYLHNDSKDNYIGWGIDLTGSQRVIERCSGVSMSYQNDTPNMPKCAMTVPENFSTEMIFKGPYLVLGSVYYTSDPIGIINQSRPVIVSISIVDSPQTRALLKSVKGTPPVNPIERYVVSALVVGFILLLIWRWRR